MEKIYKKAKGFTILFVWILLGICTTYGSFSFAKEETVITAISPKNQTYYQDEVTLKFEIKEPDYKNAKAGIFVTKELGNVKKKNREELELTAETTNFTFSYGEEGIYDICVEVTDAEGKQKAEETWHFIIDGSRPSVSIQGVTKGVCTKNNVELVFQVTERNPDFSKYAVSVIRNTPREEITWSEVFTPQEWETEGVRAVKRYTCTEEGRYSVIFHAVDRAGNEAEEEISFSIDRTAPVISNLTYADAKGKIEEKYQNIYSNEAVGIGFSVTDSITAVDAQAVYVKFPNQKTGNKYPVHKEGNLYYITVPADIGQNQLDSMVTICAKDQAGNEAVVVSKNIVCNAEKPQIRVNKNSSKWTNQDLLFHVAVSDSKSGLSEVTYKIDGTIKKKVTFDKLTKSYVYDLTATRTSTQESGYEVEIEAVNNCGTSYTVKRKVYIDKEKPKVTLSGVENGAHYNKNQTIVTTVQDISYENTKTVYYVNRTLDGETTSETLETFHSKKFRDTCHRKLTKEGLYRIYAVTTDAAGNRQKSNTITFVIDKTPPKLVISGAGEGSVYGREVSLMIMWEESFFETGKISIQVERTLDGRTTKEEISGFLKEKKYASLQHRFSEDGAYKITVSAEDKAGNRADTRQISFTIDKTKPVIRITGIENYQQFSQRAELKLLVEESCFAGSKTEMSGTCTDVNGKQTPVEKEEFTGSQKNSTFIKEFDREGKYELTICSQDAAGNKEEKELHFIIDYTKPEIRKIKEVDGGYYQKFQLTDSLEEVFRDLTVVSYHILLNGIEYNGTDEITEEGKYTLCIDVTDELGHDNSEKAEFIIDHTEPRVIFSGVRDGQTVEEKGTVFWKLADEKDEITAIRMNGKAYETGLNRMEFDTYGKYELEVDCVDQAGNTATGHLKFVYRNPMTKIVWISGISAVVIGSLAGVWLGIRRKEKRNGKNESSSI